MYYNNNENFPIKMIPHKILVNSCTLYSSTTPSAIFHTSQCNIAHKPIRLNVYFATEHNSLNDHTNITSRDAARRKSLQVVEVIDDDLSHIPSACIDGGANINVITPEMVKHLLLSPRECGRCATFVSFAQTFSGGPRTRHCCNAAERPGPLCPSSGPL